MKNTKNAKKTTTSAPYLQVQNERCHSHEGVEGCHLRLKKPPHLLNEAQIWCKI
jgi:hypothetical protein